MSESDEMIQAYIQKVLKLQQEQKQRPLDTDEMSRIAEELGMSDADMAFINRRLQDYIARGQGYSRYEDWESAIEEFQQAVTLSPNNIEALYGLANAYRHRWQHKGSKDDLNNAKNYVKRALQINATHDPSFKLASELNKGVNTKPSNFGLGKTNIGKDFKSLTQEFKNTVNESKWKDLVDLEALKYNPDKRLKKSGRDKKIFGVCSGIAEYFGIDPTWVRIAFILGFFIGGFTPILYIVLAFALPKS